MHMTSGGRGQIAVACRRKATRLGPALITGVLFSLVVGQSVLPPSVWAFPCPNNPSLDCRSCSFGICQSTSICGPQDSCLPCAPPTMACGDRCCLADETCMDGGATGTCSTSSCEDPCGSACCQTDEICGPPPEDGGDPTCAPDACAVAVSVAAASSDAKAARHCKCHVKCGSAGACCSADEKCAPTTSGPPDEACVLNGCRNGPACFGECCAAGEYCNAGSHKCAVGKGQNAPCQDQKGTTPCVEPTSGQVNCCAKGQSCTAVVSNPQAQVYFCALPNTGCPPGEKSFKRKDRRGQRIAICCPIGTKPARDANGRYLCK
jgi:hypothetical protein